MNTAESILAKAEANREAVSKMNDGERGRRMHSLAEADAKIANAEGLTPYDGTKADREFKVDAASSKLDIEFDEDHKPVEAPEAPEIPQDIPQAAQEELTDAALLGVERKPIPPQEQHAQALSQIRSSLEQEAADIEVQWATLQANHGLMDPAEFEQQHALVKQAIAEHQRKSLLYHGEIKKQYQAAQQNYLTDLMREIPEWSNPKTRHVELQTLSDWLVGQQGMSSEEFGSLTVAEVKRYRSQMKNLAQSLRRKVKKVKPKNDYDRMIEQKSRQAHQEQNNGDFAVRFQARVKHYEDLGKPTELAKKIARRELSSI